MLKLNRNMRVIPITSNRRLSLIMSFNLFGHYYTHEMDLSTDDVLVLDEDGKEVLRFNRSAAAITPEGEHLGSFRLGDGDKWLFVYRSGEEEQTEHKNLLMAEVDFSKQYLTKLKESGGE